MTLALTEPFVVHGEIAIEAPQGVAPPAPPATIWLRESWGSEDDFRARKLTKQPDAQGNFIVTGVYPGFYRISASTAPPNYYLDSIRVGDVETLTGIARIDAPQRITLLYKSNGGALRGSVEKCAGGRVWLFPTDRALTRADLRFSAICDSNDRYAINSIRPGEYYAIALSSETPWIGDVEGALINQSTRITIRPSETTAADLHPPVQP